MWRAPRILRLQGHHSESTLFPDLGLPAGDACCDISVNVGAADEFDWLVEQHAWMTFRSCIDDNSMRLSSSSPEVAVQLAARAYRDFVEASDMIEATVNDKPVAVGSTLSLARQVAIAAGLPRKVAKQNAAHVGTDINEGRRRRAAGASQQRQKR
eukprot:5395795-Pyramimonas_sp.AAC.1